MDTDIAHHNIEKSHRIGQSRQPGEKPRPIIAKFVRYNSLNKMFRNKKTLKSKKNSITESLKASRMEKLKELHGFRNVWINDGMIFCKLKLMTSQNYTMAKIF